MDQLVQLELEVLQDELEAQEPLADLVLVEIQGQLVLLEHLV